jgi:hypothetical protein
MLMASSIAANRAAVRPIQDFWEDDLPEAPMAPPPAAPKRYMHPGGFEITQEEYEDRKREEEDEKLVADRSSEREREARRDEMQYRTAFKTAFELGLKAGLMQRIEPTPCEACERRKERNRIAAQASRLEKRRIEKAAADIRDPKRPRRPTGGVVPPPPTPIAQAAVGSVKHQSALRDVAQGALRDVAQGALRDVAQGALRDVAQGALRDVVAAVDPGEEDEDEEEDDEEEEFEGGEGAQPPPF